MVRDLKPNKTPPRKFTAPTQDWPETIKCQCSWYGNSDCGNLRAKGSLLCEYCGMGHKYPDRSKE